MIKRLATCLLLVLTVAPTPALAADPVTEVRLYALDCGAAQFKDMGLFADTGELDGKPGAIVDPCFVVRHPKGTLLWDTGLGDKLAEAHDWVDQGFIRMRVETPLAAQLGTLGLKPADVTFVAFSHLHFDHTGNANLFTQSTWILNKAEVAWATATPSPFGVVPDTFATALKTVKTRMVDGDTDVFGDGSVRILKAPGHTPGHQVLLVKLGGGKTVILSGDLYHTRDNRKLRRVPVINVDRADTLASEDRIEKMVASSKARFVIQHDADDVKALPKFPLFLK